MDTGREDVLMLWTCEDNTVDISKPFKNTKEMYKSLHKGIRHWIVLKRQICKIVILGNSVKKIKKIKFS